VRDFSGEAAFGERFLDLFAEHDGAVFAAGAADGDGQVAFAFADVMRDEVSEQTFDAAEKFSALGKRADVLLDFGILAGVAAQGGDKVGVGQKANVENEVGVRGNTVFVAEADDGDQHGAVVGIFEALGDEVAKLVDVELGGVDHYVGEFADGLHEGAFVVETFAHRQGFAEGMRAARFAVAAEKRVVAGIDEDQSDGMVLAKMLEERRELFELHAFARIDQQGGTGKVAFAGGVQFGKDGN